MKRPRAHLAFFALGAAAACGIAYAVTRSLPFPLKAAIWALTGWGLFTAGKEAWEASEEGPSPPGDGGDWTSAPVRRICPQCFQPAPAEVLATPHGEVKCAFCGSWFHVHAVRLDPAPVPPGALPLACPRCAAPVPNTAEVSPNGDVRCAFCGSWFNVRSG